MNISIAVESEKGHGQDAACHGENYIFVFDGLGGRGGTARTNSDGIVLPEAKIASNAAAKCVAELVESRWNIWNERILKEGEDLNKAANDISVEFHKQITKKMYEEAEIWGASTLPTTIAGWVVFPFDSNSTIGLAVWAGDSRCYSIQKRRMRLHSKDDNGEEHPDAMLDLRAAASPPMSNRIGIDKEFVVHCFGIKFTEQTIFCCCTDGVYNAIESPMHLEYDLRYLYDNKTAEEIKSTGEGYFAQLLGDDSATMEFLLPSKDSNDLEIFKAILKANVDKMEVSYIDSYPILPDEEFIDIDRKLTIVIRYLVEKEHFHDIIKNSIEDLIKNKQSFPRELPCGRVLDIMQDEFEADCENQSEIIKSFKNTEAELVEELSSALNKLTVEMLYGHNEKRTGIEDQIAFAETQPGSRYEKRDNFREIELMDVFSSSNTAHKQKKMAGAREYSLSNLSKEEQEAVYRMIISNEMLDGSLDRIIDSKMYFRDFINLISIAEQIWKQGEESREKEVRVKLNYLKDYFCNNPYGDTHYIVNEWYKSATKPKWLIVPENLSDKIEKSFVKIREFEKSNEKLREDCRLVEQKQMDFWEQYKPVYEAWDAETERLSDEQFNAAEISTAEGVQECRNGVNQEDAGS